MLRRKSQEVFEEKRVQLSQLKVNTDWSNAFINFITTFKNITDIANVSVKGSDRFAQHYNLGSNYTMNAQKIIKSFIHLCA